MGKIAFVTGGSKGIGRAIVEKLSGCFDHVIFTYNTDEQSASNIACKINNCTYYQCNVNDYVRSQEVSKLVLDKFDSVDVLINNAGFDNDSTFINMSKSVWDEVIDINLKSVFAFTKFFVPGMIERTHGRIINITSIAGFTGVFGKSNYAAAKAGIVGFTKSLALELASKNITVNAVAPGAIETDMLYRIPEKYRVKILESIPSKKFGKPEDVASLVNFLLSDQASYITGQTIHINGGSYLY